MMSRCLCRHAKWLLLVLSPLKLVTLVLIMFAFHLQRQPGQLTTWLEMTRLALQADVLHGLCAVASVLGLAAAACQALPVSLGRTARLGLALLLATLGWSSLVKVAELHGLQMVSVNTLWHAFRSRGACKPEESRLRPLRGLFPPQQCQRQFSESVLGIATCWFWVPSGLAPSIARSLCRPWALVGGALLSSLRRDELGHRLAAEPKSWWEWRELLVGLAFWSSLCSSLAHCARRRLRRRRRPRLLPMVIKDAMITFLVFVLTAEPCLWLWAFLFAPVLRLLSFLPSASWMQPEPLQWEEFAATGAVIWLVARALYVSWHLRQQRAETRERLEALLEAVTDTSPDAVLEPNFVEGPLQPKVTPPTEDRLLDLRKALYRRRLKDLLSEVPGAALLPGALHVIVRRSTVLQDTLSIFWQCPVAELLAPNMSVSFEGEVGIDAGGLLRNWFDSVGLALSADASSPLVAEADATLAPRRSFPPGSGAHVGVEDDPEGPQMLQSFLALGRFLATAVLRGKPLPLQLSSVCCKLLLQEPLTLADLWLVDPDFYRYRIRPLLHKDGLARLEKALGESLQFPSTVAPDRYGQAMAARVTKDNVGAYLAYLSSERLVGTSKRAYAVLLQGFWDVLPLQLLQSQGVRPEELSALISGQSDVDPKEWRMHSNPCTSANAVNRQVVEWFWDAVQSDLTAEQRCRLLRFVTGSSRPPPGGFADLKPPFAVEVSSLGSDEHLPTAHTCVNKLVLYFYRSKSQLLEKLLCALVDESFGTA